MAPALEDPTRPMAYRAPAASAQALKLESVLVGPERTVAVINGKVVTVGDEVAGAKVLAIKPGAVTLSRAGRTETLKPRRTAVKAKADQ